MDFKNIPKKYKPIPFWSWNEKLTEDETRRQTAEMAHIGMGGFFMHARGGLQTEYMGKEWFDNIEFGIDEAEKCGIKAWVYDETGWPSGFGGGIVNGMGIEYQQKYLRMEDDCGRSENVIARFGGKCFYYDINPFYVDTLDKKVIKEFIDKIYAPYYEKYKNRIEGFFTDEPQISRNGIPWSFILEEEYEKEYGEQLIPHLEELFCEIGNFKDTRMKFWRLVTMLFSSSYMKQIYDWCEERGLKLTGHLIEGGLDFQTTASGTCMPHYEYFHIPGVDWLGRNIDNGFEAIQACSAAQQLGKKQFLTESFAMCGHNASFSDFRKIMEWQMVRGVTMLCPHLEGYSMRGIRKRDYPPAMYEQQPWWEDYSKFLEVISRIGMILTDGEILCDTLVIHPQSMAWACFDNGENHGIDELHKLYNEEASCLDRKHIPFHLGDEILMERHGHVENDELVIGKCHYKNIIMFQGQEVMENTKSLLAEFVQNGGKIKTAEEMPNNDIIDNPNILYTLRGFDDKKIHYFVNCTGKKQKAVISIGSKRIDPMTGDILDFDGYYEFNEYDSILVIEDGENQIPRVEKKNEILKLDGEWEIINSSENAITLDYCTYYFDGVLQEENGYILNVGEHACALKRPVNIRMNYKVNCGYVPEKVWLVIETPEIFKISINGKPIDNKACGYFRDRSFKKLDIGGTLITGENIIEIETDFCQSESVYENIEKGKIFESEKNKLTYDMEIEPIYIIGDFSVKAEKYEEISNEAFRCNGFSIEAPKKNIYPKNIESQGYFFFAGEITLKKSFKVDNVNYSIDLTRLGGSAVHVSINDGDDIVSIWNSDIIDISKYLHEGDNTITLKIANNLRNLMGPHHLAVGEHYHVGPGDFYKEKSVWNADNPGEWNDDYCMVKLSLESL